MREGNGELIVCEKGTEQFRVGKGSEVAVIDVSDPRAYVAFARGNIASGEAYMNKLWESPDLACLFRVIGRNLKHYNQNIEAGLRKKVSRFTEFISWLVRKSRTHAKSNITHHYNLGNDMFAKFLDRELLYSCAVYPTADADLDAAQHAKLELLCKKAQIFQGARVLDLGCGWGGLSVWAARHYDAEVVALTLSDEQYAFVKQRIVREKLEDKITPVLMDYRDYKPDTKFDRIISVEMIEAVGPHNFANYYQSLRSLLKQDGRVVLQAITVPPHRFDDALYDVDFVKEYIFPGGACPSRELMSELGSKVGLNTLHVEDITKHYETTLRHWRENFSAAWDEIIKMGYSENFCRMMCFYFSYCEAGFAIREIEDLQVTYEAQSS